VGKYENGGWKMASVAIMMKFWYVFERWLDMRRGFSVLSALGNSRRGF
jgi:hypothetical protein